MGRSVVARVVIGHCKPGNGHQRVTALAAIQVKGNGPGGGGAHWGVAITRPERSSGRMAMNGRCVSPAEVATTGTAGTPGIRIGKAPLAGMKNTAARSTAGRVGEVAVRIVRLPIRTASTWGPVTTYATVLPRANLVGPEPPPKMGPQPAGENGVRGRWNGATPARPAIPGGAPPAVDDERLPSRPPGRRLSRPGITVIV